MLKRKEREQTSARDLKRQKANKMPPLPVFPGFGRGEDEWQEYAQRQSDTVKDRLAIARAELETLGPSDYPQLLEQFSNGMATSTLAASLVDLCTGLPTFQNVCEDYNSQSYWRQKINQELEKMNVDTDAPEALHGMGYSWYQVFQILFNPGVDLPEDWARDWNPEVLNDQLESDYINNESRTFDKSALFDTRTKYEFMPSDEGFPLQLDNRLHSGEDGFVLYATAGDRVSTETILVSDLLEQLATDPSIVQPIEDLTEESEDEREPSKPKLAKELLEKLDEGTYLSLFFDVADTSDDQ